MATQNPNPDLELKQCEVVLQLIAAMAYQADRLIFHAEGDDSSAYEATIEALSVYVRQIGALADMQAPRGRQREHLIDWFLPPSYPRVAEQLQTEPRG
jgi:hypothetical protein